MADTVNISDIINRSIPDVNLNTALPRVQELEYELISNDHVYEMDARLVNWDQANGFTFDGKPVSRTWLSQFFAKSNSKVTLSSFDRSEDVMYTIPNSGGYQMPVNLFLMRDAIHSTKRDAYNMKSPKYLSRSYHGKRRALLGENYPREIVSITNIVEALNDNLDMQGVEYKYKALYFNERGHRGFSLFLPKWTENVNVGINDELGFGVGFRDNVLGGGSIQMSVEVLQIACTNGMIYNNLEEAQSMIHSSTSGVLDKFRAFIQKYTAGMQLNQDQRQVLRQITQYRWQKATMPQGELEGVFYDMFAKSLIAFSSKQYSDIVTGAEQASQQVIPEESLNAVFTKLIAKYSSLNKANMDTIKRIAHTSGTIDKRGDNLTRYGLASAITEYAKRDTLTDEDRAALQATGTQVMLAPLTIRQ